CGGPGAAGGGCGGRRLRRALHSRPAAVAGQPLTGWALFGGSMLALYLTPLYRLSLEREWLHEALHVHFLAAGALFLWPIVGVDPVPRRLPHGGRLLAVFLAVPFHAVLGMALLAAREPIAPQHSLADHRAGAGLLWIAGDLLGLVAALVVAAQWMSHEDRQAAREDRRLAAPNPTPE
ncbi:MAG TPA: cytochrome c oxidase assembly protein, partial [Acidimicrobiales bacterium]|nr:cytochrome c oxidase assembly protein [Acidimicrobiales bacterium]